MRNIVAIALGFVAILAVATICAIVFEPPVSIMMSMLGGMVVGFTTVLFMDII